MSEPLENFRSQIDAIDEKIIALLKERMGIVKQVGEYKREHAPDNFPIRPAREATMVKRIANIFKNSSFSPAAAAQLWRTIIGTSTALEADLTISVYAPDGKSDLFWLAREYFGPAASITRQPHVKRVIGDMLDGKAAIGIVPPLSNDEKDAWWPHMLDATKATPKVFAHLPFCYHKENPKYVPSALALGRINPEDSGDDVSLYVLQVEHDVSQHKLQTAFGAANLEVRWIHIASMASNQRHHLIEIKGFAPPESSAMTSFLSGLNGTVQRAHYLGAYALPFTLDQ